VVTLSVDLLERVDVRLDVEKHTVTTGQPRRVSGGCSNCCGSAPRSVGGGPVALRGTGRDPADVKRWHIDVHRGHLANPRESERATKHGMRALMNLCNVVKIGVGTRAGGLRNTLRFSGSELARSGTPFAALCILANRCDSQTRV
jgi:hypothetical protein